MPPQKKRRNVRMKTPAYDKPGYDVAAHEKMMADKKPLVLDGNIKKPPPSRPSGAQTTKPVGDFYAHNPRASQSAIDTRDASVAARKTAATSRGSKGKLIAIGAGTAAVAGGGYLLHRSRQNKKEAAMSKNLINPFEEVIVFGKAYSIPEATNVRSGSALVHTGRHVGHGQKLTHVHNSKGGGGRATRLERYTGKHASHRVGPF